MATPGWYALWCRDVREVSPYHPETWTDEDRAAYRAALDAWGATLGPHMTQDQRDALENPPVRNPYKSCPCHRQLGALGHDELGYPIGPGPADQRDPVFQVTAAEVAAWLAEDPLARAFVPDRVARALTYIERFNPKKREQRAQWEALSAEALITERSARRAARAQRGAV